LVDWRKELLPVNCAFSPLLKKKKKKKEKGKEMKKEK